MTSYRQLQSDDVSDQFDLDTQPDGFRPRGEVEVQIEPTRAKTKSRVRMPNTNCSKNKVIAVLVVMLLIMFIVASLTIYELDKHGIKCHSDEQANKATTNTPTEAATTTSSATTTEVAATTPVAVTLPIATNGDTFPWDNIRLPSSANPFEYLIFLHPNLSTFEVEGTVEIHFNTTRETSFIVLHSKDIHVSKPDLVELVDQPEPSIAVEKLLVYENNEQISVHFVKSIPSEAHCTLTLHFNYTLADGLDGFYRSSYKKDGQQVTMASTQFEATSARRAFPCFDEPAMKAKFSLQIVHDEDHITLFNMPAKNKNEVYQENLLLDTYHATVRMSTYLVAFVVCDFTSIHNVTSNGTRVSMYAPVNQINQANLALDVVQQTIPFYETFFDIEYPLPKQDMIAIPDFSAGAMENWGLITYRGSSVLYKPNVTTSSQEVWIAITVTHELAHQWFGNLVTMEWWSDLWLNEGFASFVEYIGADNFNPDWHMMDKFIVYTTHVAMLKDQQANSHPISVPVSDPRQISEVFDPISYSKGATILKMLQSFMMRDDKDIMKLGIQLYLKKHKYKNAVTADLWEALSQAARANDVNVDIAAMMDTWTLQMGFPVINVTKTGSVTQQRYLIYPQGQPSNEFNSTFGYKWTIPLTYFIDTAPQTIQSVLMLHDAGSIDLDVSGASKWFKINTKQSGMYRVNYQTSTWVALQNQLMIDHSVLSAADRANLIDDVFSLAWAGYVDYGIALDFSKYLINENDYVPIDTALHSLSSLGAMLWGREGFTYYKKYIFQQFGRLVKSLGKEDTGEHLDRLTRQILLQKFSNLGHPETLDWAKREFQTWMETNTTTVGANLHELVQCGGVQAGGQHEWDYAWKRYQNSTAPTEKSILQRVLACTQDPSILSYYLHSALDKSKVLQQDSDSVIVSVALQPAGSYMALRFVIENWEIIRKTIGIQPFVMTYLISETTSWISTEFEYQYAEQFISKQSAGTAERTLKQVLEDMKMRIAWRTKYEDQVTQWFKQAIQPQTS